MPSLELSPILEMQLRKVVQENFYGNSQAVISAFLQLHEKYGWKEQLRQDVAVVRQKIEQAGGISEETIDDAIKRYRKQLMTQNG